MSCVSRAFRQLLCTVLALFAFMCSGVLASNMPGNCSLCQFPKHHSDHPGILDSLKPLCGKRFSVTAGTYFYNVGICVRGSTEAFAGFEDAGVIQTTQITEAQDTKPVHVMVGDIKQTELMAGSNWIMVEYEGGNSYGSHCSHEGRRSMIMITCSPNEKDGKMRWLEENANKTGDCYYLFELEHNAVCSLKLPASETDENGGLSAGSIVCIILACVVGAYLVFGILFMRFLRGAKGLNQIPNFEFWQDFGSLQADGCDLICRCSKSRYAEAKPYHGIGDHQIESANDGEDLDEHLLPM